ncbi:hypothetical protein F5884DRAFT_749854 [Xylogone sp. PMI_703]|nr:hypothetical protein F5884DRAFT_749854 [Xylogone sp. PMI_703]
MAAAPSSPMSISSSSPMAGSTSSSSIQVKSEEPDVVSQTQDTNDDETFIDIDSPDETITEDENSVEYLIFGELKIKLIPEASVVQRTLGDLYDMSLTPYIVLDPEYQRDVVWDDRRASALITSTITGNFVPPIVFNVVERMEEDPNNPGKEIQQVYRVCVDGKQRLTSIKKFMDGLIGFYDSNDPPRKWYYRHPIIKGVEKKKPGHEIIPDEMKELFRARTFCCWEYNNLSLKTEENMFQSVQRGIALTPAEKLRAMSTEWAQFTKEYEENYSTILNLSKQKRASGYRLVLTILTMVREVTSEPRGDGTAPSLRASQEALLKVLYDETPIQTELKMKFKTIFDKYESLVKMCSTNISPQKSEINKDSAFAPAPDYLEEAGVGHVRTFSPLELVATAILIAYHMDTCDDHTLLEDIKEMRRYLRENHKDLRINAHCWVSIWEYITVVLPLRHATVENTPPSAAGHPEETDDRDSLSDLSLDFSPSSTSSESPIQKKKPKRANAKGGKALRQTKRVKSS